MPSFPSTIRVLIVEDQPSIRKHTQLLVENEPGFTVLGACGSVQEAVTVINATLPELLLLDIQLPDGSGFDILEQFPRLSFKVIFLTAFQEHAIRAIKYGALDYLLKPLDADELSEGLERVKQQKPADAEQLAVVRQQLSGIAPNGRLVIRTIHYLHVIQTADIVYCQGSGVYTTFFLKNGKRIMASKNIKVYEDLLCEKTFLRPHQSYLVNSDFIDKYHKEGYLILKDNTQIPVATRRRESIIQYLSKAH